jgi:hypothetical protein
MSRPWWESSCGVTPSAVGNGQDKAGMARTLTTSAKSDVSKHHLASHDDFNDLLATLIWGASLDLDIRPRCLTIQNKEISICHLKKARAAILEDDPR